MLKIGGLLSQTIRGLLQSINEGKLMIHEWVSSNSTT